MSVNTTQHAGNYNDFEGLANLRSQAQRDQKSALNEQRSNLKPYSYR